MPRVLRGWASDATFVDIIEPVLGLFLLILFYALEHRIDCVLISIPDIAFHVSKRNSHYVPNAR